MLYTGHGDAGTTTLIGSARLPKCDLRLELLGALDEAQAHLGLVRALLPHTPWAHALNRTQQALSTLMTAIALGTAASMLPDAALTELERDLADWESAGPPLTGFVTPGTTIAGAHLHVARTVIRRAERHLVALHLSDHAIPRSALPYLNRLSSWVFALALHMDSPTTMPMTAPTSTAA